MSLLDTKHKKKSMTITVILHLIILFLLFYVGLTYLDPAPEKGIAVNFGTTETGTGNIQPTEAVKSAPKRTTPPVEQQKAEIKEDVITQDAEDAPVIQKDKPKQEQVEVPKRVEPKKDLPKKPDPKPDKTTQDALSSLINGPKSDGKVDGSEGNDDTAGDKGNPNGDPNAQSYYGTGKGLDGDGNYLLGGRKAVNKVRDPQECNEAGIVVVSIEVGRNGNVTSAKGGVKGTTNNTLCLVQKAEQNARASRFNSDSMAPAKQIGKIVYSFKLSQ
ncbi:MAG: protein TonB [Candidatus Latescibacterota bacterium]|jgi:protein TonB